MQLELNSTKFKKAFQIIQTLLSEQVVFMTATSNKFYVEAGNGSIYLKLCIPDTKVIEEGAASINSKYITALKLNEDIKIETNNNKLQFRSGNIKGSIDLSQDTTSIENFRPSKEIPISVTIPKVMLNNAIQKTSFSNTLVQSNDGINLKFDSYLTASATDQFRSTLYKDKLPFETKELSVIVNPSLIELLASKIEDPEISAGVDDDIIRLSTLNSECYVPSIQIEIQNIEEWLVGVDQDTKLCSITTSVEKLAKSIIAANSIVTEKSNDTEITLKLAVTGKELVVKVVSPHGEADVSLELDDSVCKESTYNVCLSSKYMIEMLHLLKNGKIGIDFWADFVIITTEDCKTVHVMSVVSD